MTDLPPEAELGPETTQQALIGLHALARTYARDPGSVPVLRLPDPGSSLRTVAAAPLEEVPASARIALLHQLARAGYPRREDFDDEYQALAATVAADRGMTATEVLDDLRVAVQARGGLARSQTLQNSAHHEVAFLGEDICTVRRVRVDGRDAVWIFSEFETDAAFDDVADWVDPRHWPDRSPLLFKEMRIVGATDPVPIADLRGVEHWHSVFNERVQLVKPVSTLLHCDFRRDGDRSAGMTYELAFSPDNEIDVDRGFLLVNRVDDTTNRVRALKIVGFVDGEWNDVAALVCPFWTDWVRQAVRGGTRSGAKPPSHLPTGGQAPPTLTDSLEPWMQFFGESALTYLHLFDDATTRMSTPGYSSADLLADSRSYWSQLARDWAKAWTMGLETLEGIAEQGLDAGIPRPGQAHPGAGAAPPTGAMPAAGAAPMARAFAATGPGATSAAGPAAGAAPTGAAGGAEEPEATLVPVVGLAEGETLTVTNLVSIEAGGPTIPAAEVTVTRAPMPDGAPAVRVQTRNRSAPPGLYLGELHGAGGRPLATVQLYLSRATGA
jgi:hypothetical protein